MTKMYEMNFFDSFVPYITSCAVSLGPAPRVARCMYRACACPKETISGAVVENAPANETTLTAFPSDFLIFSVV